MKSTKKQSLFLIIMVFYIDFLIVSCYKRIVLNSTHFFNVGYAGIPGRPQPLIAAF